MVVRLLLLLALLLPFPASAQDESVSSLEGSWAFQIGPATIFRFDIAPVSGKDGEWRATWSQPKSFATDGENFTRLTLPAKVTPSMAGLEFDGEVELSFNDPRPGAIPDIFRFRLIDADAAEMDYVGTDLAPFTLQRVARDTPLGPFEQNTVYRRTPPKAAEPAAPKPAAPDLPKIDDQGFRLPPSGKPTR
ncbi:hypothetical protein [Tsuneonella sp. HG222]